MDNIPVAELSMSDHACDVDGILHYISCSRVRSEGSEADAMKQRRLRQGGHLYTADIVRALYDEVLNRRRKPRLAWQV